MSKRNTESTAPSPGSKRPKRSCVVKAEKIKLEKAKRLKDYHISLFYDVVVGYCCFSLCLLEEVYDDPTNLSFQRKYDDVMSELYSFCARWKGLIELESVYFFLVKHPHLKTSAVSFNYDKPKEFIAMKSMMKLIDERDAFERDDEDEDQSIGGAFQPKRVDPMLGLVEDFRKATVMNNILFRLDAHCKNKVDSGHVKNIPTVRFTVKETEEECSICLGDFKARDKLFELRCGHLYHQKCLKDWLKKSTRCPLCKEILS